MQSKKYTHTPWFKTAKQKGAQTQRMHTLNSIIYITITQAKNENPLILNNGE